MCRGSRLVPGVVIVCLLFPGEVERAWAENPHTRSFVPPLNEPEDTSELLVFLRPGGDVQRFAGEHGLIVQRGLRSDPDAYVLAAPSVNAARALARKVRADGGLRGVYVNRRVAHTKFAFVPNDPYFHRNTPVAGFPGQWHLINEHTPGLDAGVQGAWSRDITGEGVVIGIVDDGLQTGHPDLAANYGSADSWDFGQNDGNPNPVYEEDVHGISTSGVAGARGGNGVGVTGAAPLARLAGLRLDFFAGTEDMFVDATLYHSSGANTSIKVKNHSYGAIYPWTLTAPEEAALKTSAAAGTIHCFAAGNSWSDANQWDLQNSPGCICVAALGSDGRFADYSNYGACVFVTCPSSSDSGFGITTTDRMGESFGYNGAGDPFPDGNFTSDFGGTSSASPLAAGVMALGKQVQPKLDVRFAKHLLARTCDVVDSGDSTGRSAGGWQTNAAGFHFNQNYGFGLINAEAFTAQTVQYTGVSAETTVDTGLVTVNAVVPDNDPGGISRTYAVGSTTPVEAIEVYLRITISGESTELDAWLTSPSGTRSRLLPREWPGYFNTIDWWFTSNQFWGENPAGTWTLTITDHAGSAIATWGRFRVVTHMGTLVTSGPPFINGQPSDLEVAEGGSAAFAVQAIGTQPLFHQWQKNGINLADGGNISGATAAALQISNCQVGDAGSYRCVVSNAQGNATSNEADLSVVVAHIVESRSGGQNHDRYSEVGSLSNTAAKSAAVGATAGIGGRWGYMDRPTYGIGEAAYSFTPTTAGLYDVSVTWPASTTAGAHVEHLVAHAGGTSSVLLDQNAHSNPSGADNWNSLGQYVLAAGGAYTVVQTNETYWESGTIFQADAVRWRLVSGCEHPPTIVSVNPSAGQNDQTVDDAVMAGSSFAVGQTSVKLVKAGETDIVATDVNVVGGSSLTCDFDLQGAAVGVWDVVVSVASCPPAVLAGGFSVMPSVCPNPPTVTSISPDIGLNNQTTVGVTVQGSHFAAGQTGVKLAKAGLPDIMATNVVVAPGGGSLTCNLGLWGAVTGPWNLVVTVSGCPPVVWVDGFTISASGASMPLAYVERWDGYATGTSDPNYVATWPDLAGSARHSIFTSRSWSVPNSLLVNTLPGGPFGITNDLSAELRATVPGAVEVVGSDANPLDAVFHVHMNSTGANLKYGDVFIELSKGDVHAPSGSSPNVLPVLAFGVTYAINGAIKCPYFFDGRNWVQISGGTSVVGWNYFKMTVKSNTCLLSEYKVGTYVGTQARQYTGGFDRVSLRTVNNQGDYRALDDVYLNGGVVASPAAPTISQHPQDRVVCQGQATTFGVSAAALGAVAYRWQRNGVSLANGGHYSGVGTPTLTVSDVDGGDAGDYRCIVSNVGGSAYSNPAALTVAGGAPVDFDDDCDVDAADLDSFAACESGPAIPHAGGESCQRADVDVDGDVDQDDFGVCQRCYSGENNPADPNCAG